MKFYFYIAFYSKGSMRLFNTKRKPKPMNVHNGEKLLKIVKFTKELK